MSFFDALVLGIVQGVTEFLPVSSSGHLVLADALLGLEAPGVFVVLALHVATLLSVCWVYRARILALAGGMIRADATSWRYVGLLLLASIPAGLVGVTLMDVLAPMFDRPVVAAALLLVTGGIVSTMRVTVSRAARDRPGPLDAFAVGLAQAVAVLPGISRSGSTVAVGTALGVSAEHMAEFSFLMSVPATAGAAVLEAPDLAAAGVQIGGAPLIVAFLAALVSGILAIRLFVRMIRHGTFHRFAYYCWAVGATYLLAAWLEPGLR